MTSHIFQALILAVTLTGVITDMHQHEMCLKMEDKDQMPCKKTLHALRVKAGDSLILNCTCFNKTNGQWTGPLKTQLSARERFIPYTHGTKLNPNLNRSKYMVIGGYDLQKCFLIITNFVSDDDGTYMCQYITSSTINIDVYTIEATNHESITASSYGYCWIIMGSLVGVLIVCFVVSHCVKRVTKSSHEILPVVQYDEIGSISYHNLFLEPISDGNHETTSRVFDSNSILFRHDTDSSDESSVIRQSSLTQDNDDYENPYLTFNPDDIDFHLYRSILSNKYQNTTFFQTSTGTNDKEEIDNHWLVIYLKEK